MLGDDAVGMKNPVSTMTRRMGLIAFLVLAVGLAFGGVSWLVAPECKPTPIPDPCEDAQTYCDMASIFDPAHNCKLQASGCMKTCGCCSLSPKSWCPGEESDTPFSIFSFGGGDYGLFFWLFLAFFSVLSFWRLCRAPPSPAKTRTICLSAVSMILTFALFAGFAYLYHITDCHGKFRGFSDVCLLFAGLCFFVGFMLTFIVGATAASLASSQYDALIASVRDGKSRRDANILVLDVSENRIQRFLDDEKNQHAQLTVTIERSGCAQCCRVWLCLYVTVLLVVVAFFGGLHYFVVDRSMGFLMGFLVFSCILMAWARIKRTQGALDHAKNRELQQWSQEVRGPQQLIFFHNQLDPMGLDATNLEYKSVIALGTRRCSFFSPAAAPTVPGVASRSTHTRIVDDTLELRTVVRNASPGLVRVDVRAESTTRLPLDPNQVAQVRGWLALHRDIFEFETAPDSVELAA